MLLYRVNKVYSDQNAECAKYRTTMEYYEFYRERAIFKNVINVKNYLKEHLNELTDLVRFADNDISEKTQWSRDKSLGAYVFKGVHKKTVYTLNLFTGVLLKNGAEASGLPSFIREH